MVDVRALYDSYESLSKAGEQASQLENEFKVLIEGCSGDVQCKRLAAQFIPKFIKFFPSHCEDALDRCLDMCEDADVNVRHESVKNLARFSTVSENVLIRVADVLIQLCLADDEKILEICRDSLKNLAISQAPGVISACFLHIDESIESSQVIGVNLLQFAVKKQLSKKQTDKVLLTDVFNKIVVSIKQINVVEDSSTIKKVLLTMISILKSINILPDYSERIVECVSVVLFKVYPKPNSIEDCAHAIRLLNLAKSHIQKNKELHHYLVVDYVVMKLVPFFESVFNKSLDGYSTDSAFKNTFQILLQDIFTIFLYIDKETAEKSFNPFAELLNGFLPSKEDFYSDGNCYIKPINIDIEYLHLLVLFFYLLCCKNDALLSSKAFLNIKEKLSLLSRVINGGNLNKTGVRIEETTEAPRKRNIITAPDGSSSAKVKKGNGSTSNRVSTKENDILTITKNLHCTPPELSMISPSWRFDLSLSKLRTDIINWNPEKAANKKTSIATFDDASSVVGRKVRRIHELSASKELDVTKPKATGGEGKKNGEPVL